MPVFVRLLTAVAMLLVAGQAYAAKQDFTLVNRTGEQIDYAYVTKHSSNSWGEDIMGKEPLYNGDSADFSFEKGERGCYYDLMVIYNDGEKTYWENFDLCTISRIQLFWDRKAGTTRAVTE